MCWLTCLLISEPAGLPSSFPRTEGAGVGNSRNGNSLPRSGKQGQEVGFLPSQIPLEYNPIM